jgi:hypothetical protein
MAENETVTNTSIMSNFTEFINKDSFSSLASCALIVGIMVQVIKPLTTLNPLLIVFIMSTIVSVIKVVLSNDYSRQNIILAAINIFPLALTAAGGYDLVTTVASAG